MYIYSNLHTNIYILNFSVFFTKILFKLLFFNLRLIVEDLIDQTTPVNHPFVLEKNFATTFCTENMKTRGLEF